MDRLFSALALLQSEAPEELPVDMETLWLISIVATLAFLAIGVAVGYWVYKDAADRANNGTLWAIGVALSFLLFPLGLVVPAAYFVLRGEKVPETPEEPTAAGDW